MNQKSSEWLECVNKVISKEKSGKFLAKDKADTLVVLEWEKADIMSPCLAMFKKNVSDIAAKEVAATEVKFLQKYPEVVVQGMFAKACKSYFENGVENVDWQKVQDAIASTFKEFYLTDISSFDKALIEPLANDIYFNVTLKDHEMENIVGFAIFAITPALSYGDVKLIHLAIKEGEKAWGWRKLLMGSIFKIIPDIKRIFTGVRPTNENIINMYTFWGFEKDLNPVQDPKHKFNPEHFVALEYRAENSCKLQKTKMENF